MENLSPLMFNSLDGHTPIKRLGLSRKRKSMSSPCTPSSKINSLGDESPVSSVHDRLSKRHCQVKSEEPVKGEVSCEQISTDNDSVDCERELSLIKNRIAEKLETLEKLKANKNKIVELQNLIQVWKNGCKNAYLHMEQLLKERQTEDMPPKIWLKSLGIWNVMVETFQNDSDICLSDDSE